MGVTVIWLKILTLQLWYKYIPSECDNLYSCCTYTEVNYSLATQEFCVLQYDQKTSVEFYAIKPSGKDEEPAFFIIQI